MLAQTRWPRRANANAEAAPMPVLAPVISVTGRSLSDFEAKGVLFI